MEFLQVSRSTFYRLIRSGKITAYALDGTDDKRYKLEELEGLFKPIQPEQAGDGDAD
jgi:excisionase family DNA binding protein